MIKKYYPPIHQVRFSNWHYNKLPPKCHAFNLDFIEVRNGNIIALIEYKRRPENMTKIELNYLKVLSRLLKIPYFIISCDVDEEYNIKGEIIIEGEYPDGRAYYKQNLKEDDLIKFYINLENESKN